MKKDKISDNSNNLESKNKIALTILFDGGCPLCLREVKFLKSKDKKSNLEFIDIDSVDYSPKKYNGISYRKAMGKIHGINSYGLTIEGIDVFAEAYKSIGLGWIYYPTKIIFVKKAVSKVYEFWAKYRLTVTGRPSIDKLCECRETKTQNIH